MPRPYLAFVDWLKAVGMGLIVLGHVDHGLAAAATPPFYPKQLGVTMFVFATGYTLARERRAALGVVINRWFDVWAYGLLFALLMTAVYQVFLSDGNPSDYLPLFGGFNVLFDNFPVNPTTWYIGTYLHLLLLWALVFRGRSVSVVTVLVALAIELSLRALLVTQFGQYVGYQSLFNWLGVLVLGLYAGERELKPASWAAVLGVVFIAAWPLAIWSLPWTPSFPFRIPAFATGAAVAWLLSLAVTGGYWGYTLSAFAIFSQLPAGAVVRFFARNTLIVFIAHMPAYFVLEWLLAGRLSRVPLALTEFVICFVGISLVSEAVRPLLRPVLDAGRLRVLALAGGR